VISRTETIIVLGAKGPTGMVRGLSSVMVLARFPSRSFASHEVHKKRIILSP